MAVEVIGLLGVAAMFLLMFLRVPIAIAMAVPAFLGIIYLRDYNTLLTAIETIVWDHSFSYTLSTIPMFVLMGELLFAAGISGELFDAFRKWFGKLRGGLGIATVSASAVFSAASGSSLANTATMGVISAKEMLDSNYNKSFAAGTILAGGTLGILIPPSTAFIIYGMLTEQSIGQLLIAGIIPGIMLMGLYILTIITVVLIKPSMAPLITMDVSWRERFASLKTTIWIVILFIIVIGGMYMGYFNPTEAAGFGAFATFIIALIRRKLTLKVFVGALSRTLKTTSFLFAIIIMAFVLNYFLTITRIPLMLADFFNGISLPNIIVFLLIIVMYIILGAVMDSLAMIVITIPIILPIIEAMDFSLIWFGVIIVLVMELGLISPPVGMAAFVLRGSTEGLRLEEIFKGAIMFMVPIFVLIGILYFFPEITLFLPSNMY